MGRKLPLYKGPLVGTKWSEIALTEETKASLAKAALRSCPTCRGKGYVTSGKAGKTHPCICINRREVRHEEE